MASISRMVSSRMAWVSGEMALASGCCASYAEIASTLGVTVSSVKKYMARATEHCLVYALARQ